MTARLSAMTAAATAPTASALCFIFHNRTNCQNYEKQQNDSNYDCWPHTSHPPFSENPLKNILIVFMLV